MATFIEKPSIKELSRVETRFSFLYLEKCHISRENNAISVITGEGIVKIPSAVISVLLLGPGTTISHDAADLAGSCGMVFVWIGENGVRFYAGGRSLNSRSDMLIKQAELASNTRKHLEVVRNMYKIRFPDEDVDGLTLQQLRGREGSRVRKIYKEYAKRYNVCWNGREYDTDNFDNSTPVNKALSAGNACLYGLTYAVIFSLELSPGLGFVHVGHANSFVYDIADLYKAEFTIPLAFEMCSSAPITFDIPREIRKKLRIVFFERKLIQRMVQDLHALIIPDQRFSEDVVLWDGAMSTVRAGVGYYEECL